MGLPHVPHDLHDASDPQAAMAMVSWERCAWRLASRYRLRVDRGGRSGQLRFVAVASSLATRPYAVVTSDLGELAAALGCPGLAQTPAGERSQP
jgi:hypothetical protein